MGSLKYQAPDPRLTPGLRPLGAQVCEPSPGPLSCHRTPPHTHTHTGGVSLTLSCWGPRLHLGPR